MNRGVRRWLIGRALAVALSLSLSLSAAAYAAEQKLTAADGAPSDAFGWSVAVDGDTAVVGAPLDDSGANLSQGAAYVYERTGDGWTQTAKLTASDGAEDDLLGYSVAIDGDTIVAGAPYDDDLLSMDTDVGSVYTFASDGAAGRTETGKLTDSDGVIEEALGLDVGIDGDTIVAGAPGDFVGANSEQGAIYTFARTGPAARNETARLTALDGAMGDVLGRSVAIQGDTIVGGAPFDNVAGTDQGSAYTFARSGPDRTQSAKLTASDGSMYDEFGFSVAIDGDTIIAGQGGDGPGPTYARGAAYTFARSGLDRTQTAKLTASDGTGGDLLGEAVAIDGSTIVAGARFADVGSSGALGAAYTFARSGPAARTEAAKLAASDGQPGDELGYSVAIDGAAVLVGVRRDLVGVNVDQGSAVIFDGAADATAPKTKGLRGPGKVDRGEKAKFRFKSSEGESTFRCKLDRKKFKPCRSPHKVKTAKLRLGKHVFAVYAIDEAGNRDPTPAKLKFRVMKGTHGG